jgi:hypothetical protein
MSAHAFRALQERLASFQASGDASVLVDARALDEFAELRAAIGWPAFGSLPEDPDIRSPLNIIVLIGTFIWLRAQRLPEGDQLDARLEAAELLTAAYSVAPGAVPRRLARIISALASGTAGRSHAELHDTAVDMLAAATRSGDLAGVDDAIWLMTAAARTAAARTAAGDSYRPYYLSDLGSAWLERSRITGRPRDLDNAVQAHEQALLTPVPVPEDQAGRLANYSAALLARFERGGQSRDLDRAIAAARTAETMAAAAASAPFSPAPAAADDTGPLPAAPAWLLPGPARPADPAYPAAYPGSGRPGLPSPEQALAIRLARVASLSRLSAALAVRFRERGARADIDEAVQVSRTAAGLIPAGDPAYPRYQAALARVLRERFHRYQDEADLAEARSAERSAAVVPPQRARPSPRRPGAGRFRRRT